jgi:hypothetical protein
MMTMKNAERSPLTLFPVREAQPVPPADFPTRLRDFARAAAARGRGSADIASFVEALTAYHRTWTLCSRSAVPPLDERARQLAVTAYCEAKGILRRPAA